MLTMISRKTVAIRRRTMNVITAGPCWRPADGAAGGGNATATPKSNEEQQIGELSSEMCAAYTDDGVIHVLFEAQARRTPEALAVVYRDRAVTYAELNSKADQLAWYLRENGVVPRSE